jgi:hypothetical protein
MLSGQELEKIERYMREEHRKDLEALERLKRFLPDDPSAPAEGSLSGCQPEATQEEVAAATNELTGLLYQREI